MHNTITKTITQIKREIIIKNITKNIDYTETTLRQTHNHEHDESYETRQEHIWVILHSPK